MKSDEERWKWVIANQSNDMIIMCDNDMTWIEFDIPDGEEPDDYIVDFDYFIGWADGIFDLLKVVGIKASSV